MCETSDVSGINGNSQYLFLKDLKYEAVGFLTVIDIVDLLTSPLNLSGFVFGLDNTLPWQLWLLGCQVWVLLKISV